MSRALVVAVVVIVADQLTKTTEFINPDFAFGAPAPWVWLTVTIMLIPLPFVLALWPPVAAGLLVGGAMSNIFDRVVHGGGIDPILAGPIAFNLADVAIVAGLVLWFLQREGVSV